MSRGPAPGRNPTTPPPNLTQAACNNHNPDIWHQPDPTTAITICHTCPERKPCLTWALANPQLTGVLGATTPTTRQLLRQGTS